MSGQWEVVGNKKKTNPKDFILTNGDLSKNAKKKAQQNKKENFDKKAPKVEELREYCK